MNLKDELLKLRAQALENRNKDDFEKYNIESQKRLEKDKLFASQLFEEAKKRLLEAAGDTRMEMVAKIRTDENADGCVQYFIKQMCEEAGIYFYSSCTLPYGARILAKIDIDLTFSAEPIEEKTEAEKEPIEPKCCQLCKSMRHNLRMLIHP